MDRIEALERINNAWNDNNITLGERITNISNDFYGVGLDVPTTAAYIKATPAELDALLSLGSLDDDIIELISEANPPKTTWSLLANASESEIKQALNAFVENKEKDDAERVHIAMSEFVYQQMIEIAGPTPEQMIETLTGVELAHAQKKAEDFNALTEWETKFLKSVVAQKKKGKTLSAKQILIVLRVLTTLADKGAIKRNSIDGDNEICDKILDVIGR